ncbi:hypothetical protein [Paenibacillus eucommiae]|uniref:Regulator of replication initiation timing n=1 Tax=Paenibacillus eucommiae TaxID=1355755 RepID=A0ABS4IY85_9BACL|nr:hypothetical protein [Paenibacillus eucommiae]MBP1992538.1 regulator of replication initiation timing [Paenibacillus eucommiae]
MKKKDVYEAELAKLNEIFEDVEPTKAKLVEGLVEDAAFLKAENHMLRQSIAITGMVKIHPQNQDLQKPVETAKQYLKNVNAYSVVIKTLNGILSKNGLEGDDEFDEFIRNENAGT